MVSVCVQILHLLKMMLTKCIFLDNGIIDKKGANCLRSIFTKSSLTCNDMETDFNAMNKGETMGERFCTFPC
jgi:hypothetical protein